MYERESWLKGPVVHACDRQFARVWSIRQNSTPEEFSRYSIRHIANCDNYEISFAAQRLDYMPISIVGKMPLFRKAFPDTVDGRR